MTGSERLTITGSAAVLLSCSALLPVFFGLGWLLPAVGVLLAVALTGMLNRRAGLPVLLQLPIGLAVVVAYTVVLYAGATLHHVVLPGSDTVRAMRQLFAAVGGDLDSYAPPAPTTTPLVMLVVLGVGGVAVLVDAAVALGRAALAGLPLLLLFAVPSGVLSGGLGWFPFAMGAAGWLALLLAEGQERVGRWGRPLTAALGGRPDTAGLTRVGRRIGAAALGIAVVVPALLPGLDARLLDGGAGGVGTGVSGGSRTVVTYNPITRLRGQLTLPKPLPVLRYTTDDPNPDYLRMTTLGSYDGGGWRQEPLSGNLRQNGVGKQISLPQGRVATTAAVSVSARISLLSLDGFWLPAPATPTKVTVKGPWMWDPKSESVFATRAGTKGLGPYTVQASRVRPDPNVITSAAAASTPDPVRPYDTSIQATKKVTDLTANITRGHSTDYAKAVAIQGFFRNSAEGFVYNDRTASGGSPDALEAFLTKRAGFCEQYASAMAAMLRLAGVPSRVAIGFTAGTRATDGSYIVTTSDAHAWPEAWFAGSGWTRFEPTPSRGGIVAPSYSAATAVPGQPQSAQVPGGTSSQNDIANETPQQRAERLAADRLARAAGAGKSTGNSGQTGPSLRALAAGVLVALLAAAPALTHAVRRRRRWRRNDPTAAWEQLRDDAADVGHRWRPADTPRSSAARLVGDRSLTGEAAAALARLAGAIEQSRYARPAGPDSHAGPAGVADVAVVRRALLAGAPLTTRLRAWLLPPSTMRWATATAGSTTADLLDALDSAVSAVRPWVRRRLPHT